MSPRYSVVVPVFDEEGSLAELHRRLAAVLDRLDGEWELILVDDGSRDRSFEKMVELRASDPRVKLIQLSRNFGHQVAVTSGLDHASGDAVIVMDADLQHPPEVIAEFADRWHEGFEIVYGVMTDRAGETTFKKATSSVYYRLLARLAKIDVPHAGDFRLIDRKALDAFNLLRERNRYVRGMFSWVGFRQTGVPYAAPERFAGRSKYTLGKMMRLATQGIFSFSAVPLRLVLVLGFLVSAFALAEAAYALVGKLGGFYTVPGWASIVFVGAFLGGIQLIVLGVMGEYVGLIYDEVKARPIYLVRSLRGLEPNP